jgi:hypothetical protein
MVARVGIRLYNPRMDHFLCYRLYYYLQIQNGNKTRDFSTIVLHKLMYVLWKWIRGFGTY